MDFIGQQCPVCQKRFHADDDVVVCPDCGTPHHRSCYESLGHCVNEERHAEGYDYTKDDNQTEEKGRLCPSCKKENDEDSFFCKYCGAPLSPDKNTQQNAQQTGTGAPRTGFPFGFGGMGTGQQNTDGTPNIPFLDPLGGMPADSDLGDGVTAGEAAKYVKQNTPYFLRVFANIKNLAKSKFNFSAALLTSAYLLYRKMYKLGAILFALQLSLFAVAMYHLVAYRSLFDQVSNLTNQTSGFSETMNKYTQFINNASTTDLLVVYLPVIILLVLFALKIVVGACFNRMYMKHCKQQITSIKSQAGDGENPETLLQTKGGVNMSLAASVIASAMIVYYFTGILII